ncbi:MAG: hypothetical protein ACSLFO_08505 [Acidimicrobiales bacterium]
MSPQRARAVLAVTADASADEIEAAFRRAIRIAHPDQGGDPVRAQVLLDARRCLRHDVDHAARDAPRVIVVPAPTWRDLVAAILERIRPRPRPDRPPPRVR